MGDKRVGWIAGEDLAAVSARVLAEGPEKHAGKQYWLSTEVKCRRSTPFWLQVSTECPAAPPRRIDQGD
jgi:hypothetical protein